MDTNDRRQPHSNANANSYSNACFLSLSHKDVNVDSFSDRNTHSYKYGCLRYAYADE